MVPYSRNAEELSCAGCPFLRRDGYGFTCEGHGAGSRVIQDPERRPRSCPVYGFGKIPRAEPIDTPRPDFTFGQHLASFLFESLLMVRRALQGSGRRDDTKSCDTGIKGRCGRVCFCCEGPPVDESFPLPPELAKMVEDRKYKIAQNGESGSPV